MNNASPPKQIPKQKSRVRRTQVRQQERAKRYRELKLLERAGQIKGLELQKRFPFVVQDKRICVYVADFYYLEQGGGEVVEDVKSEITKKNPVYRIKNKLFEAIYGYRIREV